LSTRVILDGDSEGPVAGPSAVDNLENKSGLVIRERRSRDRRKICLDLTPAGRERMESLDPSLQDRFLERLMNLHESERQSILGTLGQLVEMIEGSGIEASPILVTRDIKEPSPGT